MQIDQTASSTAPSPATAIATSAANPANRELMALRQEVDSLRAELSAVGRRRRDEDNSIHLPGPSSTARNANFNNNNNTNNNGNEQNNNRKRRRRPQPGDLDYLCWYHWRYREKSMNCDGSSPCCWAQNFYTGRTSGAAGGFSFFGTNLMPSSAILAKVSLA